MPIIFQVVSHASGAKSVWAENSNFKKCCRFCLDAEKLDAVPASGFRIEEIERSKKAPDKVISVIEFTVAE